MASYLQSVKTDPQLNVNQHVLHCANNFERDAAKYSEPRIPNYENILNETQ